MNEFEQDIIEELHLKFDKEFPSAKLELLRYIEESNYQVSNRILRCIIYLSSENLEDLKAKIKIAKEDWRDIIYYAEYDDRNNQIRNFKIPFPN